jgi:hypothetical protein
MLALAFLVEPAIRSIVYSEQTTWRTSSRSSQIYEAEM